MNELPWEPRSPITPSTWYDIHFLFLFLFISFFINFFFLARLTRWCMKMHKLILKNIFGFPITLAQKYIILPSTFPVRNNFFYWIKKLELLVSKGYFLQVLIGIFELVAHFTFLWLQKLNDSWLYIKRLSCSYYLFL